MKSFVFQKFTVQQSSTVFRVGTDGVLLGALCDVSESENTLEIGTGTGIISLMLAQRNPKAKITGIDLNEDAANLALKNFEQSEFRERLQAKHQDIKTFSSEKFDAIVSNPPYFLENLSSKDKLARQHTGLDFNTLISKSSKLLSEIGVFCVIIPSDSEAEFCKTAFDFSLHLKRKINIFGIKDGVAKRCILEFSFQETTFSEENFIIEESPRKYSEQYLEATRDFHLFQKNKM